VQGVSAGDGHDGLDLIRKQDRPLERLHPAERATGHGRQTLDPEHVQERALGPHHVRDSDHREVRAVWLARQRIGRRWPCCPAAAPQQVRGDHEKAVGIERLAGADHPVPPAEPLAGHAVAILGPEPITGALFGRCRREACRVGVAAERVAHQNDVVAPG